MPENTQLIKLEAVSASIVEKSEAGRRYVEALLTFMERVASGTGTAAEVAAFPTIAKVFGEATRCFYF